MTWASILGKILPYLVGAILGALILYVSMPEPEVPEPITIVEIDSFIVTEYDTFPAPPPEKIIKYLPFEVKKDNYRFKGESDGVQVITNIFASCHPDSVIFEFKHPPVIREREKMVVSIDSIKTYTVFIKPPWHKTWLVGFVEGVVLVGGSVYLAGKLK